MENNGSFSLDTVNVTFREYREPIWAEEARTTSGPKRKAVLKNKSISLEIQLQAMSPTHFWYNQMQSQLWLSLWYENYWDMCVQLFHVSVELTISKLLKIFFDTPQSLTPMPVWDDIQWIYFSKLPFLEEVLWHAKNHCHLVLSFRGKQVQSLFCTTYIVFD